jgi:hypothetical protein
LGLLCKPPFRNGITPTLIDGCWLIVDGKYGRNECKTDIFTQFEMRKSERSNENLDFTVSDGKTIALQVAERE